MKCVGFVFCILYFVYVINQCRSDDGFEDLKAADSVLSFFENDVTVAGPTPRPLMVPLTLIQGADSKGAGMVPTVCLFYFIRFRIYFFFLIFFLFTCFGCSLLGWNIAWLSSESWFWVRSK